MVILHTAEDAVELRRQHMQGPREVKNVWMPEVALLVIDVTCELFNIHDIQLKAHQ